MESTPATPPQTDAAPHWNLDDLYTGPDDPALEATLADVKAQAEQFQSEYNGRLADLSAQEMLNCIARYESITQAAALPGTFASLRFAADTAPENGAFYQKMRERLTDANLPLIFFQVQMGRLPQETLDRLVADPILAPYRHFLEEVRAHAPFQLSEAEEKILTEKAVTGRQAFTRLFEEIVSNLRFDVQGEDKPLTLSEVADRMQQPDRNVRRAASDALSQGLETQARTLAYIHNTLIADKTTDDRLRGYTFPEQARHLNNELSAETVETVVSVSEAGYPLVARYYKAKARLLGLDQLYQYDRYAPLTSEKETVGWEQARNLVLTSFQGFDPKFAGAAQAFFDGGWIDAAPRPGKRGGAFCSYVTPHKHPYIFQSFLGKMGDVRTLAHELGHGVHSFVSRGQSYLNFHGTLPMAEVASTFAEEIVFEAQVKGASDRDRLAAYAHQIEQAIATIFRQTALYRFEQSLHRERRAGGELSVARIGELWQEQSRRMFGDSVVFEEGHAFWWSYIPHFINTPFYVYAYTFGEMLALALFARYKAEGPGFAPRYLEMLSLGGSKSPQELVAPLGVDLTDPAFWQGALALLEEQISEFEQLAAQMAA